MANTALTIRADQPSFTQEQKAALRQMGAEKATDADLALFFHQCKATGLDPFRKQIYLIGRWDRNSGTTKYTAQTSIDGYRVVAERSGAFAGCEETWEYDAQGKLVSATVTVRKIVQGHVCSFSAVAHWDEYVQTTKDGKPSGLWGKLPHRMLGKCAESTALRRAFSETLGGIYTEEEMPEEHAAPAPTPREEDVYAITTTVEPMPEIVKEQKPISQSQVKRIHTLISKLGIEDEKYRERLRKLYSVESSKDLTFDQAADLIKRLDQAAAPQ